MTVMPMHYTPQAGTTLCVQMGSRTMAELGRIQAEMNSMTLGTNVREDVDCLDCLDWMHA